MTPQTALVLARALHFSATAVIWGGGGLLCLLRAPGAGRLVRIAAAIATISGLAWLGITLVTITGDTASLIDGDAWLAFADTAFGPPWAIRIALLAGCLGLAVAPPRCATLFGLTILGGALAVDQAWLGHAATGSGAAGVLMIAADSCHIVAAYAWTGALPVLALQLAETKGSDRDIAALRLFSTIGLLVVATILATGLANASFRIARPIQALATPYGQILATKIVVFSVMLLLAWVNRSLASGAHPRRLLIGVTIETAFGFGVLSAAALLGITAPPP